VALAASLAQPAAAQDATLASNDMDAASPTWAQDVLPIFQESCQECHRPNSIAPMSLLTYDQARRYARRIEQRVENRIMPPWHINPHVGIQEFKNDRGITDEQRQTIVDWVEAGTPQGDMAQAPAPRQFDDDFGWQLADQFGEPDQTWKSEPYDLPAETQDKWFRPVTPTGLTEPKWVKAIEIRPVDAASRTVVHHTLAYLLQQENGVTGLPASAASEINNAGLFMEWAVGKRGQIFRPDAGKLMLPGSSIRWEMHLHASGTRVPAAQVELAVWYYDKPPKHRTILTMFDARGPNSLDIPPGEIAVTQQSHVLPAPARLENFQPHMHMRGKAMEMEAIYPDGHREVLAFVDNFQWNWQINYVFADDAAPLLPKGTNVVITAWHDNRAENPSNPDPRQWIGWGDRTVDEMAHDWTDVTYLSQEDFDQLVAERAQRQLAAGGGGD
jgi:mono/diheme cytochrome c family protein